MKIEDFIDLDGSFEQGKSNIILTASLAFITNCEEIFSPVRVSETNTFFSYLSQCLKLSKL